MQIRATRFLLRWAVFAGAACVIWAPASTVLAQLRFSGPSNQTLAVRPRENPVRPQEPIRQAYLQAPRPAPAAQPSLVPQLPVPAKELEIGPRAGGGQPPAALPGVPGTGDAGLPIDGEAEPLPLPVPTTLSPQTADWQSDWGDVFDSHLVQQDEAILYSTNNWFRRGIWYSQADVVALLRTETQIVHISADNSGGGPNFNDLSAPLLSTKNVTPTYRPGTRLSIGRMLGQDVANRDYAVELTYFGLFEYNQEATLVSITANGLVDALGPGNHYFTTGTSGFMVGAATPGFGDAKQHVIQWDSDLNNFELNFRIAGRPERDRIDLQPNGTWVRNATASHLKTFLLGLRSMTINEMFSLRATFADDTRSGFARVKTRNDMFGVQGGGELSENYGNWSWGVRFKAGGLYNFAGRDSLIDVVLASQQQPLRTQDIDNENLAAVVEAGLVASYQFRTNLVGRVAYDAMFVQGIAVAPENMSLAEAFPKFEVTGDAIFHGLSVGLEMLW